MSRPSCNRCSRLETLRLGKASSVSSTLPSTSSRVRSFKLCSRGLPKTRTRVGNFHSQFFPSNSAAILPVFWGPEIFATKQDFNSGKVESRMERWRGDVLEVAQEAKIDRLAEERRARRATSAGVGGKATRRAGDREARGVESNPSAAAIPKREPSRLETLTSSPHNPKPLSERVSENRETLGRQGGGGVGVFRRAAMDAGRS